MTIRERQRELETKKKKKNEKLRRSRVKEIGVTARLRVFRSEWKKRKREGKKESDQRNTGRFLDRN